MEKPMVTFTAYDAENNELTSTIEVEVRTDAAAIELWQYLRLEAEKWAYKYGSDKQVESF